MHETQEFICILCVHSPLFYDVVQLVHWLVLFQVLGISPFSSSQCAGQLLGKGFMLPQLLENGFMSEKSDVFGVVEGGRRGGPLVGLFATVGLTGEYTCESFEPLADT